MLHLLQSVIDRVKAMFTLDAALDFEQEFVARQAERKAALMRRADEFQNEGWNSIAADLRRQAENLSERRPLQCVFAFLDADDPAEKKRQVAALALTEERIRFTQPRVPASLTAPITKRKAQHALDLAQADPNASLRVPQSRRARADRLRTAVVGFCTEGDHVRIQFRCDNLAVEYRLADPQPGVAFAVPFTALADLEGSKDDPIRFRVDSEVVVAEWTDGGVPQMHRYPATQGEGAWLDLPSAMTSSDDPTTCASLADVVESAGSGNVRFATHCVHLRGQKGEAIGTDGHQLLIVRGLNFPWDDDILIPRMLIFACRDFATAGNLEFGRGAAHLVVRAGPWTVWLPITKDARYPNVEQIIPDSRFSSTRLSLGVDDADFLTRALPRLPGGEDEFAPVTLHLNGHAIVRAKGEAGPATELFLTRSRTNGDEVRINTNRCYLQRAAKLGLLELRVRSPSTPIVATDATRTFVWQPLDPKRALVPSDDTMRIESSPSAGIEPVSQPTERNPPAMNRLPSQPQERPRETDAEAPVETVVDPLQEAEAIKTQLRELLGRTGELVAAIKRQRRQAQLVRSTLASLKQLQEVA